MDQYNGAKRHDLDIHPPQAPQDDRTCAEWRREVPDLMARCLPELRRRSRHLLPTSARQYMCPGDLVQDVMLTTWRVSASARLTVDEHAGLLLYLQRALTNRARSEARRARRRFRDRHLMPRDALGPSPLDEALAAERLERVRDAIASLRPLARQLVRARYLEQWPWSRVAEELGFDTPDAARVATARAVRLLSTRLHDA
jgi:RNA polymerase sigma factor (sigma-70 family)